MRIRREHVVVALVLAWTGRGHASEEDVVIDRAASDLGCSEFRMTRAANHYYVAGCGRRRKYECNAGSCTDVTGRPDVVVMPNAGCVAEVSANVGLLGCACLGAAARKPISVTPVDVGACAR